MKKFLFLFVTAILLVVAVSLPAMATETAAAYSENESKNVIFVMDSDTKIGDGSGRNAENPYWADPDKFFIDGGVKTETDENGNDIPVYENGQPVYSSKENYKKTALYQAASDLRDTGGTIVICGPVKIGADESYGSGTLNKDFIFPKSDKRLTITSVYDGVDYQTTFSGKTYGGAKLCLETPAHILLNSPVLMEYMRIQTTTNNLGETTYYRTICANGNELVMGKGIKTSYTDGGSNGYMYVSIVGGSRYGNLNSDTNITIMSGQYGTINGGIWGVGGSKYVQTGDAHVTIDGDINDPVIVRGTITGTSTNDVNVMIDGDVYLNINGARFGSNVAAVGNGGFAGEGHKAVFKVGKLKSYNLSILDYLPVGSTTNISSQRTMSEAVLEAQKPGTFILDLEDQQVISMAPTSYTADLLLSRWTRGLLTNGSANTTWGDVIYPASWATAVADGHGLTVPGTFLSNEALVKDASLDVTYVDPYTSATITDKGTKVNVVCNTETSGEADFKYTYGNINVLSGKTNVVTVPTVELLGVRIKTEGSGQAMRFVAVCDLNGVTIVDKGVMVVRVGTVSDYEKFTLDNTFGTINTAIVKDYSSSGKAVFEAQYDYEIPQGDYNTSYAARAYVKFNVNGKTVTVYSDVIERNPYEVARAAVNGTEETTEVKSFLTSNLIDKVNNYDPSVLQVSEEELQAIRNKATAYMDLQANIEWSPSQTFFMYNSISDSKLTSYRHTYESGSIVMGVGYSGGLFEAGKTYRGMPYTSSSDPDMNTSNYEAFASLIDKDGVLDITQIKVYNEDGTLKKQITPYTGYVPNWTYSNMSTFLSLYASSESVRGAAYHNYTIFPGSHCSQAVFSAWNTVLNNRNSVCDVNATYNLVPGKDSAVMAVGPYEYIYTDYSAYTGEKTDSFNKYDSTAGVGRYLSDNGYTHVRDSDSLYIAKYLNSAEVMYESYNALKPGDAMIQYLYNYSTSLNADATKAAKYSWTGSGHTRMVMSVQYNEADPGSSVVTTLECANWTVPVVTPGYSGVEGSDTKITDNDSCWMERHYTFDKLIETGYLPVTIPEFRSGISYADNVVMSDVELGAGIFEGTISSTKQIVSVTVEIKNGNTTVYSDTNYLIHEAMHLREYDISKLDLGQYFTAGNTYNVKVTVGTPGEVEYDGTQPIGYTPTSTQIMNYTFAA